MLRGELIEAAARAYILADAAADNAKARRDEARDELNRLLPQQHGELVVKTPGAKVTLTREYQLKWDLPALKAAIEDGEVFPDCVRTTVAVDKRKYDRLNTSDREDLDRFLTKKLGPAKISLDDPEL